jgi:hypothetical protein
MMLRRVLRWIIGLAIAAAVFELTTQAVFYCLSRCSGLTSCQSTTPSNGHIERTSEWFMSLYYPWDNVGIVTYTHLIALLVCVILTLIAIAVYTTVKYFKGKEPSIDRRPGEVVRTWKSAEEQVRLSRTYIVEISAICILIATLSLLLLVLLPPPF